MHSARVYLCLARCSFLSLSLSRTLRTTNSLCAPHSVTLSKTRPARREHFERTCRARGCRAPKRVQHAGEITHAARASAEFTERGCDKNSFSRKAVPIVPAPAVLTSRRTFDSSIPCETRLLERERESFAETFRGSSYRVSAPRYFVCLVRFAWGSPFAVNSS